MIIFILLIIFPKGCGTCLRTDDGEGRPVSEVRGHDVHPKPPQRELGGRRQAGVAGAQHGHAG